MTTVDFAHAATEIPTRSPALSRVARGQLCAGCGACAGIAPGKVSVALSGSGFLRPVQSLPLTSAEEGLLSDVCPGIGQTVPPGHGQKTVLWGEFLTVQTGWSTDPALRHRASSGGALSALLGHLLDSGVVDAVVQIGASGTDPIGNEVRLSRTRGDIADAAGSRYAPSAPLAAVGDAVRSGRRHAFVGKPCDAAALRSWARLDPAVTRAFPIILSFFCAGVPSRRGTEMLLERLGAPKARVTSFRYRGNGWPGEAVAQLDDGSERRMSYHESWGGILSKHVQHRCKICADGTGMAADIVCADAWESDDHGYPVFDDRPGLSLVMARTPVGQAVIEAARKAQAIETAAFDEDRLDAIQPGQRERRRAVLARLAALWLLGRPTPRYCGLGLMAAARQNPLGRNLKNFLGMLRRAVAMAHAKESGQR